jgi:hypothetical protein
MSTKKIREVAMVAAVIPPVVALAAIGGAAIGLAMGVGAAYDMIAALRRPRAAIGAYPD